jgi:hypothetical protein
MAILGTSANTEADIAAVDDSTDTSGLDWGGILTGLTAAGTGIATAVVSSGSPLQPIQGGSAYVDTRTGQILSPNNSVSSLNSLNSFSSLLPFALIAAVAYLVFKKG